MTLADRVRPGAASPAGSSRSRFARRRRRGRLARWKALLSVLVLAALAGAAGWLLWFSDHVVVDTVAVEGVDGLSRATVLGAADIPVGTPLLRVDLEAAEQRVQRLAPVAAVEVSRDWPGTVVVVVAERDPVAVLTEGETYRALDGDGVVFRRFPDPPPGLPLVRADELASAARGAAGAARADALREVAAVVQALQRPVAGRVDHVEVSSLDAIELVLADGVRVRWGSAEESGAKAAALTAIMQVPAAVYDVSVPTLPTTSGTAPPA